MTPALPLPPTLVYAARFYDARPKVRTYSHLYLWHVGEKGRGKILTTGNCDDTEPQATPDGKTVVFIRTQSKTKASVCQVDVQNGKVRTLYAAYSAAAPSVKLENLKISPNGYGVLVYRTVYDKAYPQVLYKEWLRLVVSQPKQFPPEEVWSGKEYAKIEGDVDVAWAADGEILYRLPPHTIDTGYYVQNKGILRAITNGSAPGGYRYQLDLNGNPEQADLKRNVSPNGVWIICRQATWSNNDPNGEKIASPIRIDDNEEAFQAFPAGINETVYWLSDTRLVGVERDENAKPVSLHFFTMLAEEPKSGTVVPKQPVKTVALHLQTNAQIVAALKEEGDLDFSNLYVVDTVPNRSDGFVLGTPWHRSEKGVRVWINAQTGAATLWSKCGPPHPSPDGAYFWAQPGSDYAVIGKRPNGTDITEPILGLQVASYVNPGKLIPVVSGAALTGGADWLPAQTKEKSKP